MLVVLFTSSPTLPLSKWETDLKSACHADVWWTLNSTIPNHRCPLCREETIEKFYQDRRRDFFVCGRCQLVFVPPEQLLSEPEEKAAYDCHQNSPTDPEYRRFLSRLFLPLRDRIAPESHGLDFGSGPGPTLSIMFEEIGQPFKRAPGEKTHMGPIVFIMPSSKPVTISDEFGHQTKIASWFQELP